LHLLTIGFEEGSFVQFLPVIIGFHGRSSFGIEEPLDLANGRYASKGKRIFGLASSRIEGPVAIPAPCATFRQFSQETVTQTGRGGRM